MKFSLCADIMYVAIGEKGPIWPDTDGIISAMHLAKENGLDGVEIFGLEGRDLERINHEARTLGIEIRSSVCRGATLLGDPSKEEELVEAFKADIPFAKSINCPNIVLNAAGYARNLEEEEVLASMERVLKTMAKIAEENAITILVEPLTDGFFKSAEVGFELIKKVASDNVKLIYDIFHFQNIEGKLTQSIRKYIDLIGDIHAAGSPARCELTVSEVNYPYIIQVLDELNYTGNFCLEFNTFQDREDKVRKSCSILPISK